MTPTPKWFDRKFELGLADDRLPDLIGRLRRTPDRIEALLDGVPAERLAVRVDGGWSILENVGHLHDLEALSERRLDDFEGAAGTLSPADLENRATWNANHNARSPAVVLGAFRAARERFCARVERMRPEVLARAIPHPRLGQPMRVVDLTYFMAEHDDHHLERLREMLAVVVTHGA